MKIPNISGAVRIFGMGKALVMAHRPEILFGASVVGTVSSVVLAAKGGYEARGKVDRERMKRVASPEAPFDTFADYYDEFMEQAPKLTLKENAGVTWMCYMPAAITTFGTLGATTGLHIVHVKEKKAIAAAALMAIEEVKSEAKQYVDDVMGVVDENTTEKGKEKINKALDGKPQPEWMSDGEVTDLYLIREPITGRDIWASKVQVEEAIVEVGQAMNNVGYCSLNDFWSQAGWGRLPLGDELGWSGELPALLWHDLNGQPITGIRDDGKPWRSFRFLPSPEKGFEDGGV